LFQSIVIQLHPQYHPGKSISIEVKGDVVRSPYIQSVHLNGTELRQRTVPWKSLVAGCTLEMALGNSAHKE
jgi:putative alpha-1,2-mannosidase